MATQQDYINKSILERICLKNIFQRLSTDYDWQYHFTDEQGYDLYDSLLVKFKKDTGTILNTYFVEMKVRDTHYPTLLLEKKKYQDLLDLVKKYDERNYLDKPSEVIYISTTPQGSYWFNLSKVNESELNWIQEMHWISTTDKSKGKTLKWVTYLSTDLAKFLPIKSTDKKSSNNKEVNKIIIEQKQTNGLYNFLFSN